MLLPKYMSTHAATAQSRISNLMCIQLKLNFNQNVIFSNFTYIEQLFPRGSSLLSESSYFILHPDHIQRFSISCLFLIADSLHCPYAIKRIYCVFFSMYYKSVADA